MLSYQIIYVAFIILVRPFKVASNNIVECINELFFVFLVSYLIKYNTEEKWSAFPTKCYMYILFANSIIVVLVITVFGCVQIFKKIWCKAKPRKESIPQIDPPKMNVVRFESRNRMPKLWSSSDITASDIKFKNYSKSPQKSASGLNRGTKVTPVFMS